MWVCRCSSIETAEQDATLDSFARLRAECPALKQILVPDCIWQSFETFCSNAPDEAHHLPTTYLAFRRKHLADLTEVIHRFCLVHGLLNPRLTEQYKKDLAETWILADDYKERFVRFKMFQGRLAELTFGSWLQRNGWRIRELEAHGGSADFVAVCPSGRPFTFEVKHLGKEEVAFDLEVISMGEAGVTYGWLSLYSPIDYLLFRIYEAARKLSKVDGRKVAVVVLSEYEMFQRQLKEKWIDWHNPRFFRKDSDIEPFLQKEYISKPNLDSDINCYISQIDEIWFCEMVSDFTVEIRQIDRVRA